MKNRKVFGVPSNFGSDCTFICSERLFLNAMFD